jgi:NAD(P)-dependent dehydrogenase (short-subunit alcohol dehydrogenase family)
MRQRDNEALSNPEHHHLVVSPPHCEFSTTAETRAVLRNDKYDGAKSRETRVPLTADPFRLDGRLALVTGAGRGIGRAIAVALAGAGAELLLNSRTPAELARVADEIAAAGGKARPLPFDVTDSDAAKAAIAGLPRLDLLVNNAGVNRPQPFLEVDDETLDRLIALNVKAAFVVAQAAARHMVRAASGVIVNMSSQMGHVGSERERTVYVMTKHAVEGLTKAMAAELAPRGVRVCSIAPTFIDTPLTAPFFENPEFKQWVEDRIPLGRIGRVEEVANAVRFLCSPAASLVTGSSLLADGGWTSW